MLSIILSLLGVAMRLLVMGTECLCLTSADGYSAEDAPAGVPADAQLEAELELLLIRKVLWLSIALLTHERDS